MSKDDRGFWLFTVLYGAVALCVYGTYVGSNLHKDTSLEDRIYTRSCGLVLGLAWPVVVSLYAAEKVFVREPAKAKMSVE
jgi:hypothetical protein